MSDAELVDLLGEAQCSKRMVWWKPRGVSQIQRAACSVVGWLCGSGTGAEQEGETGERGGDSSSKALHTILKMRSLRGIMENH